MIKLPKKSEKGFTVIELIIVIPIISVIAIGIISLVMNMFLRILANNIQLNLLLEAQTVLLSLQDELLFTTEYGEVQTSNLNDPYAPVGGWEYDTEPNTLIIYETTLDAPRRDPDREFVYRYVGYSCSTSPGSNPIAYDNVIYFTEDNPDNDYKTLYRRILTPQYSTCGTNYRVQTCPEINVGTDPCFAVDSTISDRVVDFQVSYFDINNNPSAPGAGEKVTIDLQLGDDVYGQTVSAESSITMRKIN